MPIPGNHSNQSTKLLQLPMFKIMTANKFLEDSKGNKSSKRIWGSVLLGFGIIFASTLFVFSLKVGAKDAATASSIINMFLISGGSLLGIGIFENNKLNKPSKK